MILDKLAIKAGTTASGTLTINGGTIVPSEIDISGQSTSSSLVLTSGEIIPGELVIAGELTAQGDLIVNGGAEIIPG